MDKIKKAVLERSSIFFATFWFFLLRWNWRCIIVLLFLLAKLQCFLGWSQLVRLQSPNPLCFWWGCRRRCDPRSIWLTHRVQVHNHMDRWLSVIILWLGTWLTVLGLRFGGPTCFSILPKKSIWGSDIVRLAFEATFFIPILHIRMKTKLKMNIFVHGPAAPFCRKSSGFPYRFALTSQNNLLQNIYALNTWESQGRTPCKVPAWHQDFVLRGKQHRKQNPCGCLLQFPANPADWQFGTWGTWNWWVPSSSSSFFSKSLSL